MSAWCVALLDYRAALITMVSAMRLVPSEFQSSSKPEWASQLKVTCGSGGRGSIPWTAFSVRLKELPEAQVDLWKEY